jgi:hypothetical protein
MLERLPKTLNTAILRGLTNLYRARRLRQRGSEEEQNWPTLNGIERNNVGEKRKDTIR